MFKRNVKVISTSVFQGLLPRGKMPNPLRERNAKVNKLVQDALSSVPHGSFLNVDPGFVLSDGSISHQDMYDYLHLTSHGYQAVCEPLHAHIKSLLEKPDENWVPRLHKCHVYTTAVVLSPDSRDLCLELFKTLHCEKGY